MPRLCPLYKITSAEPSSEAFVALTKLSLLCLKALNYFWSSFRALFAFHSLKRLPQPELGQHFAQMLIKIQMQQGTMIRKAKTQIKAKIPVDKPSSSLKGVTFLSFVLSLVVSSLVLLLSLVAAFSSRVIWSSVKPCLRRDSLYSSENSALFSSSSSLTVGSVISMTTSSRKLRSSSMESSGNTTGFTSSFSSSGFSSSVVSSFDVSSGEGRGGNTGYSGSSITISSWVSGSSGLVSSSLRPPSSPPITSYWSSSGLISFSLNPI